MALRGIDRKKNLEAWEEGVLEVVPGSLKLQGVSQTWRSRIGNGDVWNLDDVDGKEAVTLTNGAVKPQFLTP